jgi:hypothetical protein
MKTNAIIAPRNTFLFFSVDLEDEANISALLKKEVDGKFICFR